MEQLDGNKQASNSNELEVLQSKLAEERKRSSTLQHEKARIIREAVDILRVAKKYQKAYRDLLNSRSVKTWFRIKAKLGGKKLKVYDEPIPALKEGNVRIVSDSMNATRNRCIHRATDMPCSNGSAFYSPSSLKVGIITDDFMFNYYKDALDLVYLGPDNYREVINSGELAFVLYISCWFGLGSYDESNDNESMHYFGDDGFELSEKVLQYAKSHRVPIVFQTIEDPPSYSRFLPLAKIADFIFTSASELVEDYKNDTNNENVFFMPYGINPLFHNPIGAFSNISDAIDDSGACTVFFAGSWYEQYKQRCADTRELFDGVRESALGKLYIADRNYGQPHQKSNWFPSEYSSSIMPGFQHDILQNVHKLFDYSININSVISSPTMCAMRVFELQSLGCMVLTNYSLAVTSRFPGLFTVFDKAEVQQIIEGYSDAEIQAMRLEGIRDLFSNCTVYDRLNNLFEIMGLEERFINKQVFVLLKHNSEVGVFEKDMQFYPDITVMLLSQFQEEVEAHKIPTDSFAIILDDLRVAPTFILDLVNAFKYVDVDYVDYCKSDNLSHAFCYTKTRGEGRNRLYKTNVLCDLLRNDGILELSGFSIPDVRTPNRSVGSENKEIAVIVPVFNNGEILEKRCFRSLLRSSIFDKMRIYLVDDGSTDGDTPQRVEALSERYDNVVTYFFETGGSGGSSRARNIGFQLSVEPFVTYLNPNDEAINDGYAKLYDTIKANSVDFSVGSVLSVDDNGTAKCDCIPTEGLLSNTRNYLIDREFEPLDNRAMLIKREIINANSISYIVGGLGESVMFSYRILAAASTAYGISTPIFVNYKDAANAIADSDSVAQFQMMFVVEKERAAFLNKYGYFNDYLKLRYHTFRENWLFDRLQRVQPDQLAECAAILSKIDELYSSPKGAI